MTKLLCRLFIKDGENINDKRVRRAYGTLCAVVGMILNVLLFLGKFIVGTLCGSIAIRADAINNLSDAASQIISLVSFRIAAKPADRDHPFGHARMEYVASMIVSMLILIVGYQLLRDSVEKLIHPVETEFRWVSVAVLGVSIVVKLWMALFNRTVGNKIDSDVLRASKIDSLSDAAATGAVLVSSLVRHFTDFDPDAYMGIAVAALILQAGIRILNDTKNSILGQSPDGHTLETIRAIVMSYPEALGLHDMVVHNYGPGCTIASLHVEVDGCANVFDTHDAIDRMEKQLFSEAGIHATIHMDPIVTDDPAVAEMCHRVAGVLGEIDGRLTMHDFRMVRGHTHTNLIFDVVAPFEMAEGDETLKQRIGEAVKQLDGKCCCVITVDRA